MKGIDPKRQAMREKIVNAIALSVLMLIGGMALLGPSGFLAWGEQSSRLGDHRARIAVLQDRQADLQNRVHLLDPNHVDPDYASELVRGNLNVAHPDEIIVDLEPLD